MSLKIKSNLDYVESEFIIFIARNGIFPKFRLFSISTVNNWWPSLCLSVSFLSVSLSISPYTSHFLSTQIAYFPCKFNSSYYAIIL